MMQLRGGWQEMRTGLRKNLVIDRRLNEAPVPLTFELASFYLVAG